MVIIVTHALFSEKGEHIEGGTGREIQTFLEKRNKDYIVIKHPLYGSLPSRIQFFHKGRKTTRTVGLSWLPLPLRILQEFIIDIFVALSLKDTIEVFIGVNPLNGVVGNIMKRLGIVKKSFFYTADYAHQRFDSQLLNWVYHFFDRTAVYGADEVWNVSSRIVKERENQHVDKKKNFLVPNSPSYDVFKGKQNSGVNKYDLVIVSHITRAINFRLLLRVIKKLSEKYKKINLSIIGTGPYENEIKRLANKLSIKDRVFFLGPKDHKNVIEILQNSGIGIALYTNDFPWTQFGDSMKVREYLACGLPVIMTGVPSTADEVRDSNAGFVIDLTEKQLADSLEKVFSDEGTYKKIRKNALLLGKKYDITKILNERLGFTIL